MNAELLAGNIAAHWVQSILVAAVALVTLRLLCVRAPRFRLVALQLTLLMIVLLPVVQPYAVEDIVRREAVLVADVAGTDVMPQVPLVEQAGTPLIDPVLAFLVFVAAGAALRLAWLAYGVVRIVQFSRGATKIDPPAAAASLEAEIGIAPRYVLQAGNRGPWTFGAVRPVIALPSRFDALDPDYQRAVICHELIHVERRDTIVALLEELAVALLWFHPLLWLLRARIRIAREQVVDARVVEILGNRDGYVRCLVHISGHDLAPHFSQAGARMLRARELRARFDAIFQEARMTRLQVVFVALALVAAVGASTFAAAAALPLRAASIVGGAAPLVTALAPQQSPGASAPIRLEPASSQPLNLQFTDAKLSGVLAFIGFATSIVFTGYEESFDEGQPVTIQATAPPFEPLLDTLLTPRGLTYTVVGPRTVVIARNPTAQNNKAAPPQSKPEVSRRQINTVYPEYPQDALERGIKGTVIVDITVNAAGDLTTAAVASGPQELRASAFKAALALKFTKGSSTTAMKVAFEYTLTETSWGVRVADALASQGPRLQQVVRTGASESTTTVLMNPDETGAYRIGDQMRPPRKLKDVPPVYPQEAQEARVQGVVIMEVRIDERGLVSDVRKLRSIPLLDEAAIDAVRQWQYTPTLMNGVAVPVRMTVTVNFTLGPRVRIQVTMPDGNAIDLKIDQQAQIVLPEGRFHLIAGRTQGPDDLKVSIYGDDGQTYLGDVVLVRDGPVVQSPTTPSFGMRLVVVP